MSRGGPFEQRQKLQLWCWDFCSIVRNSSTQEMTYRPYPCRPLRPKTKMTGCYLPRTVVSIAMNDGRKSSTTRSSDCLRIVPRLTRAHIKCQMISSGLWARCEEYFPYVVCAWGPSLSALPLDAGAKNRWFVGWLPWGSFSSLMRSWSGHVIQSGRVWTACTVRRARWSNTKRGRRLEQQRRMFVGTLV